VGFGWFGSVGFKSSYFGSWYPAGVNPMCMVLGLATGGMPMSMVRF
jgi:hypothetical protein